MKNSKKKQIEENIKSDKVKEMFYKFMKIGQLLTINNFSEGEL